MTAASHPSDRPSDRVGASALAPGAGRALGPITGAESLTPGGPAPVLPERPAGRRGKLQLLAVERSLSARDHAVLTQLDTYRFLTTHHLEQLCFADHATPAAAARACRRVLQRLAELRVIEHLEREIGGVRAGSQRYIWRVGVTGDRLLRVGLDVPRDRRREPSLRFVDHQLAVADCAVRLSVAARQHHFELLRLDVEPTTWRRYLSASGTPETLKPDLYAVIARGAFEDHWYLEVDRATESLPTVVRQCQAYETYRRTGQLQRELGVFPWIAWLTPDDRRASAIAGAIAASRRLDRQLYRTSPQTAVVELITSEVTS